MINKGTNTYCAHRCCLSPRSTGGACAAAARDRFYRARIRFYHGPAKLITGNKPLYASGIVQ